MLQTENIKNADRALRAVKTQQRRRKGLSVHCEHGQLWICHVDGAIWSVVDAEGGGSVDGFDVEQVARGFRRGSPAAEGQADIP